MAEILAGVLPLLTTAAKTLVSAVPGALGGAVTGYFAGRLAERAKRADKIREEHLEALKSQLLGILAARVTRYYEPACERRAGMLERTVVQVNKPGSSVAENPYVRSEFSLQILPIRSDVADFITGAPGLQLQAENFERLYADARSHHYGRLIAAHEEFAHAFDAAAELHLAHAQMIRKCLQDELRLPPQTASLTDNSTWAEYEELALFIYRHQLGINPCHLMVFSHTPLEVSSSSTQTKLVHVESPSDASKMLALITKVSEATKADVGYLDALEPLKPRLKVIKRQLDEAIHDRRLPSRCPYTSKT